MTELKGACVIGQSGGPTSVLNASALGVIQTAMRQDCITNVYAASHGIRGILHDHLFDLNAESPAELELFRNTPSSIIGSCRYKLRDPEEGDADYQRLFEVFKKHNIRYFFYNGGNDSMDTCSKVSKFLQNSGYECRVIGVPKTIDNDIVETDHCPGYPSAAKYIATSCAELIRDVGVYADGSIVLIEAMGRHSGWLAGASALASVAGEGPAFVYLPEVSFEIDDFLNDVIKRFETHKYCVAVFSEGIHDKSGRYISEYGAAFSQAKDVFGHAQLGGLAGTLTNFVKNCSGIKTRSIELSLLQRCAAHCASQTDIDEAYLAGKAAVEMAVAGETDKMVTLLRAPGQNYLCETGLVPLCDVANAEKLVPREWINRDGNNVNHHFIDYALPLIQGEPSPVYENGLPRYPHMKWVEVK